MVNNLGRQAELRGDCVVFRVQVNRKLRPWQLVDSLGSTRERLVEMRLVDTLPRGEGDVVNVHFFQKQRKMRTHDLAAEFQQRNLKPDPYAQATIKLVDPAFVSAHPNVAAWKNGPDEWCYFGLGSRDPEMRTMLCLGPASFGPKWWFAGVPIA